MAKDQYILHPQNSLRMFYNNLHLSKVIFILEVHKQVTHHPAVLNFFLYLTIQNILSVLIIYVVINNHDPPNKQTNTVKIKLSLCMP